VLLVLAWGSTFAAVKIGLDSVSPIVFAGLRSVLGGAVMLVLAFVRSGPRGCATRGTSTRCSPC
jgi:drug/metabolite transporter (DMT)-like permease